ncbi:MAG: 30S ribosomal protein S8 [Candidatus Margulisiibacteriota bacterium]|jgi:small subunit ribosomal protein S8
MTISDPIADMFNRIRNKIITKGDVVDVPFSKIKLAIIKILKEEGYVRSYEVLSESLHKRVIRIALKYDENGESVISKLERISKLGRRVYTKKAKIKKAFNGFGINILSTSQGILTGKTARMKNCGGELLAVVL